MIPTIPVTYREIPASDVPSNLRWDVPRRNQGQIIEIAYADYPTFASEASSGSPYKREFDASDRSVSYYKRA